MRSVYPVGTTVYEPDRCWNGYTLIWRGTRVKLVNMNGQEVKCWELDGHGEGVGSRNVTRARLLEDGNLLVLRGTMTDPRSTIEEYDWECRLVWLYALSEDGDTSFHGMHHDFFRKQDGDTIVICRVRMPDELVAKVRDASFRNTELHVDAIVELNRENEIVWEWYSYRHMDLNYSERTFADSSWWAGPYNNTICDWTHINTVQALPENAWYDAGDNRFRPGNILASARTLDLVFVIDRETKAVVWTYRGDYRGGLSGPHEPHMIERGLPGAGNILIFDNGTSPRHDLSHAGLSCVLEVNPVSSQIEWIYENGEQFHSNYTSSAQRLGNGNTLICEAAGKRVFEVDPDGRNVWEFVEGTSRAYRYAYDHCSLTTALSSPQETPVRPPKPFFV